MAQQRYVAVRSMTIPRYDDEGKITSRNDLVRGGDEIPEGMLTDKHRDQVDRALESGAIRKVDGEQQESGEAAEGSEVNGPGTATLNPFPVRDDQDDRARAQAVRVNKGEAEASGETAESGPKEPPKSASKEAWESYATVLGVDLTGAKTRDDVQKRVSEHKTAQSGGGNA